MAEKVPVYDNHIHMSPSGRNVDALREFEAAGGTGLTLVTLPHREVPITSGSDFARSYEVTYGLAERAREATDLEINIAVGPYPVLLIHLAEVHGLERAEAMMMEGMEAAKASVKGLTAAQGYIRHELGRRLHLRKCPELRFIADDSIEKGFALWDKLKELEHEA